LMYTKGLGSAAVDESPQSTRAWLHHGAASHIQECRIDAIITNRLDGFICGL
jgi:hypothetical protein